MKLIVVVLAVGMLYFGYTQYIQKRDAGTLGALAVLPNVTTDNNAEVANSTNVELHCIPAGDINTISNLNFSLQNEVYTPSVKLLNCTYQNLENVDNVKPTVTYKISLSSDANGVWARKQAALKSQPSYAESTDFSNSFANLNPVKEISQGDFYGFKKSYYVELNYSPIVEGQSVLFTHGMQIMQKVLSNL